MTNDEQKKRRLYDIITDIEKAEDTITREITQLHDQLFRLQEQRKQAESEYRKLMGWEEVDG